MASLSCFLPALAVRMMCTPTPEIHGAWVRQKSECRRDAGPRLRHRHRRRGASHYPRPWARSAPSMHVQINIRSTSGSLAEKHMWMRLTECILSMPMENAIACAAGRTEHANSCQFAASWSYERHDLSDFLEDGCKAANLP